MQIDIRASSGISSDDHSVWVAEGIPGLIRPMSQHMTYFNDLHFKYEYDFRFSYWDFVSLPNP
jgi:hypothetical protein